MCELASESGRIVAGERHAICELAFNAAGQQHDMCESALTVFAPSTIRFVYFQARGY
jgi:hypothetical protein